MLLMETQEQSYEARLLFYSSLVELMIWLAYLGSNC
jgi:hypothetical protein